MGKAKSRKSQILHIILGLFVLPLPFFANSTVAAPVFSAVTLRPDPPGLTGTLFDLIKTPANDVLGVDDRGLFKWSALSGWELVVESIYEPPCNKKRCYGDPVSDAWGFADVFPVGDEFVVIAPTGSGGGIALMFSESGQMTDTWEPVIVDQSGSVEFTCADDYMAPTTMYASVVMSSTNNRIYESSDFGRSWTITEFVRDDMYELLCTFDESYFPSDITELIPDPASADLGYLGGIYGYVETDDVRMVATFGGIFASTDGGVTWVPQSRGINVHPRLRLVYTSFGPVRLAGGISEEESALFRSTDFGATFRRVGGAPWDQPFTYMRLQSAKVAYASYEWFDFESMGRHGPLIFRSTNGGQTWAPLNDDPITFEATGSFAGQDVKLIARGIGASDLVVVMKSTDARYFVSLSEDVGVTWAEQTEITSCQPHDGEPFISGSTMMIPATAQVAGQQRRYGYCRSLDGGESWSFVSVTTSSQFKPGSLLVQPDGSLLALSSLAPFVSSDNGATWSLKTCGDVSTPIGPVESGEFDETGALWVVYFDHTGASLPNVFRSPDGGCSWDVTSVSNSLDDDLEDNVLDIEPDVDIEPESGLHVKGLTGARTVRVIGVGNTGSTRSKVYWGPKPTAPRGLTAIAGKRTITLLFTAPLTKGPGTLIYTSRCSTPGRRSTTVKSSKVTHLHKNLVSGRTYSCTVFVSNPMGNSGSVRVSKTAG